MPGGAVVTKNQSFFQPLGTNGRTCFTCHQPQADWSFTAKEATARFRASGGKDPLFQSIDGINCPDADRNQLSSYTLILTKGLNRIFLPLPDNPQFTIDIAADPVNCEKGLYGLKATPKPGLSLYRRPLPASNLIFLNIVNDSAALKCNPIPRPASPAANPPANLTGYAVELGTTGYTGSMTAGSNILSMTVVPERPLFIGQHVLVVGAGTVNPPNVPNKLNILVTTVASVQSSTQYVLADAAINTVTGATVNGAPAFNGQVGISESCNNIMWDGREPDLRSQFINATLFHAQAATAPSDAALAQGVLFQEGIFTAQSFDNGAGNLTSYGANGGPKLLPSLYPDGQDSVGAATAGQTTFDIFNAWAALPATNTLAGLQRGSIARGQFIFNNVNIMITGVAGFNNAIAPGDSFVAPCTTCHNVKNVGGEVLLHVVNTGVAGGKFHTLPNDLPRFQLTCTSGSICQPTAKGQTCYNTHAFPPPNPVPAAPLTNGTSPASTVCTPEASCKVITDDPGRALVTGRCDDIGSFKTPSLRGIVARPPFFHDGSAQTLADVVKFYNNRFEMCVPTTQKGTCATAGSKLTDAQIQDLVNFLSAL
jgi:hypothetical protein